MPEPWKPVPPATSTTPSSLPSSPMATCMSPALGPRTSALKRPACPTGARNQTSMVQDEPSATPEPPSTKRCALALRKPSLTLPDGPAATLGAPLGVDTDTVTVPPAMGCALPSPSKVKVGSGTTTPASGSHVGMTVTDCVRPRGMGTANCVPW